jgi:hypothetical protein
LFLCVLSLKTLYETYHHAHQSTHRRHRFRLFEWLNAVFDRFIPARFFQYFKKFMELLGLTEQQFGFVLKKIHIRYSSQFFLFYLRH